MRRLQRCSKRSIAPTGHIAIVRDFIAGCPPQVDGAEGRRSLATVLAIYQAAGLPARPT
jgi:hypothetical protein